MHTAASLTQNIRDGLYDQMFSRLYGPENLETQRRRYEQAVANFVRTFGERDNLLLFSAPGRTEVGGNHTDHNHGRVLAASVNLDIIAIVSAVPAAQIRIQSAGYPMDAVRLDDLAVRTGELNTSAALIRGMAARLTEKGFSVGGFDAYTTSDVPKGSGLSSSAAFEVLTGAILNHLYNKGDISAVEIAQTAQYAENAYFGKPSGLMDQMACSVGGTITIDFADNHHPDIRRVDFDFSSSGYRLCIVDTGGNHADLTYEYAAIHDDMTAIASSLGVSHLRDASLDRLLNAIPALRRDHGDRAVLRALHFFSDDERVARQVAALERGDFDTFLRLVTESGHSSFEYLQNVFSTAAVREQGLSLALCLAQRQLEGNGAWRVHGGGFGGTTLNIVPESHLECFRTSLEAVFGTGSCHVLRIRPYGGICLDAML